MEIIDMCDKGILTKEQLKESGIENPENCVKIVYKENNIIKEIYLDLEYSIYNYTDSEIINLILEAKEFD